MAGELKNLELQVEEGEDPKALVDIVQVQALDEANLMIEGVLLLDSELLLEEGDEGQDWEQGEIMDFMEEQEMSMVDQGIEATDALSTVKVGEEIPAATEGQAEGEGVNAKKKKSAQTGPEAPGGVKKRGPPVFVSPRKNLLVKAGSKPGEKGVKKASTRPKNPSE